MSVFRQTRNANGDLVRTLKHRGRTERTVTRAGRQSEPVAKVGTVLARTIKWLTGITAGSGCKCKSLQNEMDNGGAQWCRDNADYITSKMAENAAELAPFANVSKRVLTSCIARPLLKIGARRLLNSAIETAEREAKEQKRQGRAQRTRRGQRLGKRLANSPTIPREPIPFTGPPRLSLMFHVWPNGDGWKRHLSKLATQAHRFERKLLGVAYNRPDDVPAVVEEFEAMSPGWEVTATENGCCGRKSLREVNTYKRMLPTLERGVNDVTFCLHAKGVQRHTVDAPEIQWWTDAMYETVYDNIDEVVQCMQDGAAIVGSFRRFDQHFGGHHGWHFSGTFYAFRNCIAFSNGVPAYEKKWWGTESWPAYHFPPSASACIFGNNCGDVKAEIDKWDHELRKWRGQRG